MHTTSGKKQIPPENRRFNFFRQSLGKTQEEMAEVVGITRSGVASIATGRSKLTERNILILQKEFNLNPRWIRYGDKPMIVPMKTPGIPIIKNIPAGSWEEWLEPYQPLGSNCYIWFPGIKGKYLFGVSVKDPSMEPIFHKDDILIIDPQKKFESGIAVINQKHGFKIGIVKLIGKNGYVLTPINFAYEPQEITVKEKTWFYVPIKVISIRDL